MARHGPCWRFSNRTKRWNKILPHTSELPFGLAAHFRLFLDVYHREVRAKGSGKYLKSP
jgi:hypothetical protein